VSDCGALLSQNLFQNFWRGDIFQVAKLVGTLQRRDNEKALSATERKIMDDARHMVTTEIAMSLEISLEEATKKISSALES
jgi:CarD family transcriptional regulator